MVAPLESLGLVDVQHQVMVIGHDSIGAHINGKDLCERQDSVFDPLAAVFKAFVGDGVLPAQKSPPHATGRAVVVGCGIQRDELFLGFGMNRPP